MKYLRRLLGFIASRLVIFTVVSTLLILAFYLAMNTSNIYILLADGMKTGPDDVAVSEPQPADDGKGDWSVSQCHVLAPPHLPTS